MPERKSTTIIENNDKIFMNEIIQALIDAGFSAYLDKKTLKIHSRKLSVELTINQFTDWLD